MADRKKDSQSRNLNPAKRQLIQEKQWESLERSFNKDFIKKVKKQYDGADRLQTA
ncbi:hypothetical protein [Bifidobacterium sp.]|uniref:hypothetical protein n=1 Tax=Bifidobacterium sp. TaxID=41200 RepID=UPI0039ECF21C